MKFQEGRGRSAGRRAFVTGGGRGIGAAVVEALAEAGVRVLAVARTRSQVEELAAKLRERGLEVFAAACDVSVEADVAALAETAREALGDVDILVNNAGIASSSPLHETPLELWERTFAVNCRGVFLATRAFLPGMRQQRWGRVVNLASVASFSGAPYISAYAASKHAVLGFTRSVALEVASKGITVNAVCPGYVDTPMTDESVARIVSLTELGEADARKILLDTNPQGRLVEPREVAAAVLYFCSEEASGITGQSLVLDGGALAGLGG